MQPLIWVSISLLLFACDAARDCQMMDDKAGSFCGKRSATVPVESDFLVPVVLATADGKPARLLLDTGASRTILSSTFLGVENETFTRAVDRLCIDDDFCIEGGLYYAWDTYFTSPDPEEITGVVGMDILQHFVFEMDRGRNITLAFNGTPCSGPGYSMTYNEKGVPFISIQIDDLQIGDVLLDTGSIYSLLTNETVSNLDPYLLDAAVETGGCSVDGCVDAGVFLTTLRQYCIKAHCVDNVETKYPVWNAVGNSYFSNYRIAFDFMSGQLVFCE